MFTTGGLSFLSFGDSSTSEAKSSTTKQKASTSASLTPRKAKSKSKVKAKQPTVAAIPIIGGVFHDDANHSDKDSDGDYDNDNDDRRPLLFNHAQSHNQSQTRDIESNDASVSNMINDNSTHSIDILKSMSNSKISNKNNSSSSTSNINSSTGTSINTSNRNNSSSSKIASAHSSRGLSRRSTTPPPPNSPDPYSRARLPADFVKISTHSDSKNKEKKKSSSSGTNTRPAPGRLDISPTRSQTRSLMRKSSTNKDKPNQAKRPRSQRMLCVTFLLFFVSLCMLLRYSSTVTKYTRMNGVMETKLEQIFTMPLEPQEVRVRGIKHYFLLPKSNMFREQGPRAILVVLHQCKQTGLDFFQRPEERIIAYAALSRNLAIIAPTSQNRENGCWTQRDEKQIVENVNYWARSHELDTLAKVGLASSSASSFAIRVQRELGISAIAMYNSISPYPRSYLYNQPIKAIPTVYVNMGKDKVIFSMAKQHSKDLRAAGIDTKLFKVMPRPFTQSSCRSRIPEYAESCDAVIAGLQPWLNADGYIKKHAERLQWQQALTKLGLDEMDDLEIPTAIQARMDDDIDQMATTTATTKTTKKKTPKTKKKKTKASKEKTGAKDKQNQQDGSRWYQFWKHPTNEGDGGTTMMESQNSLMDDVGIEFSDPDRVYHAGTHAYSGHAWLWETVNQEMAVCQGVHAMTSEHHIEVLDFLMDHIALSHVEQDQPT